MQKQNNIKMDISDNTGQTTEMYLTTKEQMKIRGATDVQHMVAYKTPVENATLSSSKKPWEKPHSPTQKNSQLGKSTKRPSK
eukprot:3090726-Ditylum_brightwellii.AAC.1